MARYNRFEREDSLLAATWYLILLHYHDEVLELVPMEVSTN